MSRFVVVLALLVSGVTAVQAANAPFCATDQSPQFVLGFADLKYALGYIMGDPTECEHANTDNGDTLQQTTTGLAVYHSGTNIAEFTDGWTHWALADQGVITWNGNDTAARSTPTPPRGAQCIDVGAGLCLNSVPDLADAVTILAEVESARPLLQTAAKASYTVRFGDLPTDVLGLFRPRNRDVIVSSTLRKYPSRDLGPVLAHELQHVSDWLAQGPVLDTTRGCLATEANAFHTESTTWLAIQGGRLKTATNDLEQEFNAITRAITTSPADFASRLSVVYEDECSGD